MLDTYKKLIANQYEAALCTLSTCIDKCPESAWDMRIGIYPFSLVAFHTLFFADYHVGPLTSYAPRTLARTQVAPFLGCTLEAPAGGSGARIRGDGLVCSPPEPTLSTPRLIR